MYRQFTAIAALSFVLTACATTYQSSGFTGGFTDTQLAPDLFRVSFSGNAFTSPERVQDFALLRAAELCISNGFKYFAVVDTADQSRTETYVTPSTAQTTGTATAYGNSATYSGTTTVTPGQVYSFYKPGIGLMVRGFSQKPEDIYSFEADFLVRTLKAKYEIE